MSDDLKKSAAPVLVMNGWAASPRAWDLCAFPRSRIFSYIEQLDGAADDALSRMDSAIIVAWSMGGATALRLSVKFREKIKGLVLVAATPRMLAEPETGWVGMSERRLKVFETAVKTTHGAGLFELPPGKPNPYMDDTNENLERGLEFLRTNDLRRALTDAPRADFPVTIFHSERDGIVRPANVAFLKGVFPAASVTMIAGGEHALPIMIPELIDAAVAKLAVDV